MIEAIGDLWTYPCDARCIMTCGVVKRDGELVMGKGVALQAVKKYPNLPRVFGLHVKVTGNTPFVYVLIEETTEVVISFPTKHHWKNQSDPLLIVASANALVNKLDVYHPHLKTIALTRPGCGNGGLLWRDVKPLLVDILDDRFVVLTPEETLG